MCCVDRLNPHPIADIRFFSQKIPISARGNSSSSCVYGKGGAYVKPFRSAFQATVEGAIRQAPGEEADLLRR